MDKTYSKFVNDLQEVNNKLLLQLDNFMVDLSIKEKNMSLYYLLGKLSEVVAIRKDKKYLGVEINADGYITKVVDIDGILEQQELPVDITAGYYKYEKGNFILDEKMKLERR